MPSIQHIIDKLEEFAPLDLQESYDNSGLITGYAENEVSAVLIALDCIEEVVEEAIEKKCNLIISHHPILFSGIKRLTGSNYVERTLMLAIKNNISIYAMHTNLDSVKGGVNSKIAEKLDLKNHQVLSPVRGNLKKLVTFCPSDHCEKVRDALFDAGAGQVGNYDRCSFNTEGTGTFRGDENTDPFVGKKNEEHHEKELRIETIFRAQNERLIIKRLKEMHPYEEVAYDIYSLDNKNEEIGIGLIGELASDLSLKQFLEKVQKIFHTGVIKHTDSLGKKIRKVAVCGGSGSFLIDKAISAGADVFVTSDIKYHQFFDADKKIVLTDIGHFESEQFTVEVIGDILKENFNTFATYFSSIITNPIKYF